MTNNQPDAPGSSDELLTSSQAAARLGISRARVLTLINAGRLPAVKRSSPIGDYWEVRAVDLDLVRGLKNGRPPKNKEPLP